MEAAMARIQKMALVALVLCASAPVGAQARDLKCDQSLSRYTEVLRVLEAKAAEAQTKAQLNPLYEADVGYYNSVLRDARQCVKNLSPMVAASR
jgi:hypothetical protein